MYVIMVRWICYFTVLSVCSVLYRLPYATITPAFPPWIQRFGICFSRTTMSSPFLYRPQRFSITSRQVYNFVYIIPIICINIIIMRIYIHRLFNNNSFLSTLFMTLIIFIEYSEEVVANNKRMAIPRGWVL